MIDRNMQRCTLVLAAATVVSLAVVGCGGGPTFTPEKASTLILAQFPDSELEIRTVSIDEEGRGVAFARFNDEVWTFINETNSVIGFLGGDNPAPLSAGEVKDIMDQLTVAEDSVKPKIDFEVNEIVKIRDGAFENFEGKIESIDPERGKLKLSVSIFGRSTPVEVEYWQVQRE